MKLKFAALALITLFSLANAQGNIDISNIVNDPILSNAQNQKDVELVMLIMKSIEDKNIQSVEEKINFVDTFKVTDEIKDVAKSYIRQNISYSDNKRIAYGIYQYTKCNHGANVDASSKRVCP